MSSFLHRLSCSCCQQVQLLAPGRLSVFPGVTELLLFCDFVEATAVKVLSSSSPPHPLPAISSSSFSSQALLCQLTGFQLLVLGTDAPNNNAVLTEIAVYAL
eukprot:719649-Hanusia_phi.AAC.1